MPKRINQKEKGIKNVFKTFTFSSYLFRLLTFFLLLVFQVSELTTIDYQNNGNKSAAVKKHGIGKGLMTVWRVVNPEGGDIPTGVDFSNRQIVAPPQTSSPAVRKQPPRNKRRQPLVSLMVSLNFFSQKILC